MKSDDTCEMCKVFATNHDIGNVGYNGRILRYVFLTKRFAHDDCPCGSVLKEILIISPLVAVGYLTVEVVVQENVGFFSLLLFVPF